MTSTATPASADLLDWLLWSTGTTLGLVTSFAVPYLLFTGQLGESARRPAPSRSAPA